MDSIANQPREITERLDEWPSGVRSVKTFDTNFKYNEDLPQNGVDWQQYRHQCFPWLAFADEVDLNLRDNREFLMSMPDANGDEKPVRIIPQNPNRQTNINNEMSVILWKEDWPEDLAYLEKEGDTTFLRMVAKHTPAELANTYMAYLTELEVLAVDEPNGQITLRGKPYYRHRKSTALNPDGSPLYDYIGQYMGCERYMRDSLTYEPGIDSFKENSHSNGFIEFDGVRRRYAQIDDNPTHDEPIFPGQTVAESEHVMSMVDWPTGIQVGSEIVLLRRLPWMTTMLSTSGTYSQKYGYWDFRVRFDEKFRQFSALFLWVNYRETFQRLFEKKNKEPEIDVGEYPAAARYYHNIHRPIGAVVVNDQNPDSMLDYAAREGLDPVIGHPEWTKHDKQEHIDMIDESHPHYVDPTQFHTVRVACWPPNNLHGFPANSVTTHVRCADGRFRLTAGALMSPEMHNGVLDPMQIFMCNPVDGNFVAFMEQAYRSFMAGDETPPIYFDIESIRGYQIHGCEAGGAGYPDPSGQYPNGFAPTPNDVTGNSGSGVVTSNPTPPPPSNEPSQSAVIVQGYTEVAKRFDGGSLLVAEID